MKTACSTKSILLSSERNVARPKLLRICTLFFLFQRLCYFRGHGRANFTRKKKCFVVVVIIVAVTDKSRATIIIRTTQNNSNGRVNKGDTYIWKKTRHDKVISRCFFAGKINMQNVASGFKESSSRKRFSLIKVAATQRFFRRIHHSYK